MTLSDNNLIDRVKLESRLFEEKETERIFTEFYDPNMEVWLLADNTETLKAFDVFRQQQSNSAVEEAIAAITDTPSEKMHEDVPTLRNHVENQFSQFDWIKIGDVELYQYENFVLAHQTKQASGKDMLHAATLYEYGDNQKVIAMWTVLIEENDL